MHATLRTARRLAPLPLVLSVGLSLTPFAVESAGAGAVPIAPGVPVTTSAVADCAVGSTVVQDVMAATNWAPLTPSKWRFPGYEVILAQPGTAPTGPRRPYEYAVLQTGPEFGSVQIDAEVRIDSPLSVTGRDVVVIFGYQSPTRFYYVHLSTDNTAYAHNGIFVVNNADRLRIDDQWNGSTGARPAIIDTLYHRVRVRRCSATGEIAVYVDGASTPLMTATNTALRAGRVGFGSFDNIGRMRNLVVQGTPGCRGAEATIVGTEADDTITGTYGSDVIATLGGRDIVHAGRGNDFVCGGDGDDALFGELGDDTLYGEGGFDELFGGPGRNVIRQD